MITLFKATGLMKDIWIDYIIKRAEFYHEAVEKLDRSGARDPGLPVAAAAPAQSSGRP